jgi:phage terminase small subunit
VPRARSKQLEALLAELNLQQQDFVQEYLVHGIGSAAYVKAYGPARSSNASEVKASQLLRIPKIQAVIAYARAERAKRIGISEQRILDEYAALAFARMPDVVTWADGDMALVPSADLEDADAAAIKKVSQVEKFIKVVGVTKVKDDEGNVISTTTETLLSREKTIELHDKKAALDKLATIRKMLPTGKDDDGPGSTAPGEQAPVKAYTKEDWDAQ